MAANNGGSEAVEFLAGEVIDARSRDKCSEIHLAGGARQHSRMLLLAFGVVDQLPEILGIEPS